MSDTPYIFDVSGAANFEQLVIQNLSLIHI